MRTCRLCGHWEVFAKGMCEACYVEVVVDDDHHRRPTNYV